MEARTTTDPAVLAGRIRDGDRAAEDEFVAIFHGRVLRMVVARVRDPQQARDISQEVLLGVIAALRDGRLRKPEKLTQFVFGTARHMVCEHFRQARWVRDCGFLPPSHRRCSAGRSLRVQRVPWQGSHCIPRPRAQGPGHRGDECGRRDGRQRDGPANRDDRGTNPSAEIAGDPPDARAGRSADPVISVSGVAMELSPSRLRKMIDSRWHDQG